ncbi:MAG: ABC transporter substrate-binding protein [Actinomycetes bacterium]
MSSRGMRARPALALFCGLALIAAACGGDDEESPSTDAAVETTAATEETDAAPETTAATEETDGATETTATETTDGGGGAEGIDDAIHGTVAEKFVAALTAASASPRAAEGEPIKIGFQNPEGDPNGSFPEFSLAAEATVEYINNELGGLGADIANGVPGRPIELVVCKMAITPDDSQRCANELLADGVELVFSSINFFGNHFPTYAAADLPVIVITPITVGDFTSPGVYSIGGGGGCLGVHTGLVEFATTEFGDIERLGIPWADTPPGVVCYYDLEKKPVDVLNGSVPGDAERAGSLPNLTSLGVPVKPATPDVTPLVTEILDFDPQVIIFSAQGADCWNWVDGMGRLGWTPDQVPLVLSGACIDFEAMAAAGDLAKGIYFVGAPGAVLNPIDSIEDPRDRFEAEIYQTKLIEYGLDPAELNKGFATQAATGLMSLWSYGAQIAADGGEVTGAALAEKYAASAGDHRFGSTPLSCSTAPAPYVAVCNAEVSATQWNGEALVPVRDRFSGLDLVAGTEIKPGPDA